MCSKTWSSSNTNIVTVDKKGKVTAVGAGTAVVTVTENGKTAVCYFTITNSGTMNPSNSLSLSQNSMLLSPNETKSLIASNYGNNLTWQSSNTNIVTVDQRGNVTGIREGTAIITASCTNGTATCTVTVSNKIGIDFIQLSQYSLNLSVGEIRTVRATNYGNNLSWWSSNQNVAVVDQYGNITGISEGTATITVSSSSKASATCTVTVSRNSATIDPQNAYVEVINPAKKMQRGSTQYLQTSVIPYTLTDTRVKVESSNSNVVSVKGFDLTAVNSGTATITLTLLSSGAKKSFDVTVV